MQEIISKRRIQSHSLQVVAGWGETNRRDPNKPSGARNKGPHQSTGTSRHFKESVYKHATANPLGFRTLCALANFMKAPEATCFAALMEMFHETVGEAYMAGRRSVVPNPPAVGRAA